MSAAQGNGDKPPVGLVIAAFAAVYLIWGSTYLAIRFAVESMPPFLMGGARFLIAGIILYCILLWRRVPAPKPAHWRNALAVGAMLLGIGNGAVNWAEVKIPSGITALLIAVTPLWFSLLDWLRPGGVRPNARTLLGIVVGFAGVALLVGSRAARNSATIDPAGAAAVLIAGFAWASGSLYARYTPKPDNSLMGVALQMMTGGVVLLALGLTAGEARFPWAKVTAHSLTAFVYLTVIGSLVGFTAYSWLLKVSSPARISTYAYVNPVIAVFLGWALAGETLNAQILTAAAVILAGVMIMIIRKAPAAIAPSEVKAEQT